MPSHREGYAQKPAPRLGLVGIAQAMTKTRRAFCRAGSTALVG